MSSLRSTRENSERLFLRPPKGNLAFYPRDYVSSVASSVARQWSSTGPNAAKWVARVLRYEVLVIETILVCSNALMPRV